MKCECDLEMMASRPGRRGPARPARLFEESQRLLTETNLLGHLARSLERDPRVRHWWRQRSRLSRLAITKRVDERTGSHAASVSLVFRLADLEVGHPAGG